RFPHGYVLRDVPLLPTRGADRISSVFRKSTHREQIAAAREHFGSHIAHEVWSIKRHFGREFNSAAHRLGHSNLVQMSKSRINRRKILSHHRLSSLAVGFANELLDLRDCFIAG